jgi:hypothetical protein
MVIVLSVLLWFTSSDYPFSIFTLLTIVLSVLLWFTSSDYPFSIFTLLTIVRRRKSKKDRQYNDQKCEDTKGVIRRRKSKKDRQYNGQKCEDTKVTASDYLIGIFWPLYCLFFFDLWLLIISLVSFDHCIVCSSLIYGLWWSHWYLLTIV